MPKMKHKEFGTQDADPKRVEKLLKRGWKLVETKKPVIQEAEVEEDFDQTNQGEA